MSTPENSIKRGHAIYVGDVGHARYAPKPHQLAYPIAYAWLELGLPIPDFGWRFGAAGFRAFSFRRRDYFKGHEQLDLRQLVLAKATALGAELHEDDVVFVLTPLANWGLYFSPLTQYYIYRDGNPLYLLAEVSNTPWNERHHYLVPLSAGVTHYQHAKNFHVSPFHPIDMQYHWQINQPSEQFSLSITNYKDGEKVFAAWYSLERQPLSLENLKALVIRFPWQNIQVVLRIYWQALKLLIKGMPFYGHKTPRIQHHDDDFKPNRHSG